MSLDRLRLAWATTANRRIRWPGDGFGDIWHDTGLNEGDTDPQEATMPHGYTGRILHIDLGARTTRIEEPGESWWRRLGGGGAVGTALLLRDTTPGMDPFDPAMPLIFTSSVMAGQPYPGLARFSAVSKSAMTGGIGESRCEGPWGWALKGCGADTLAITGRSERPVALAIEGGAAVFLDAEPLWGMTVG
ncbi:MAG: aldehyde ferredoxin oxidoreductase N-terminal domain-containing protein, partial [Thermomicrobiales bacterium]